MTEKLVLTSATTFPDLTDWQIVDLSLSRQALNSVPTIKATVVSNTGERVVVRYVPNPNDPALEVTILAGLKFINDGGFVGLGKTLQAWLLERFASDGKIGAGTVSGTPD